MSEFKTMRANDPPKQNFTMVSRTATRDRRLSYLARGVLADVIDRAKGTPVSAEWLAKRTTEGRNQMRRALGELREAGYARLVKVRGKGGRTRSYYEFTDVPGEFACSAAEDHAQRETNAQVVPDAEIRPLVDAKPQVAPDAGNQPPVDRPLVIGRPTTETSTTETPTTETQTEKSPLPVPPRPEGDLARGPEVAGATRRADFSAVSPLAAALGLDDERWDIKKDKEATGGTG